MTARQMFKYIPAEGNVLLCSKGRYDYGMNTFAYRICDDGEQYVVHVLSDVHPRHYTVPYGVDTTVKTIELAVLYNEWRARVIAARKGSQPSLEDTISNAISRSANVEVHSNNKDTLEKESNDNVQVL